MKNCIEIPENGRLTQYQEYIKNILTERGFIEQDVNTRLALLVEEVGELAKSIRKFNNEKIDINSKIGNVDEEIADVFFVLISIANKIGINISEAFVKNENKNNSRVWV